MVEAAANFQGCGRSLIFIAVVFGGDGLELRPCTVVGTFFVQKIAAEPHVRFITNPTAGVSLDNRLPNFDGLFGLLGLEARITRLDEFSGGFVLYQRAAQEPAARGILCRNSQGQQRHRDEYCDWQETFRSHGNPDQC